MILITMKNRNNIGGWLLAIPLLFLIYYIMKNKSKLLGTLQDKAVAFLQKWEGFKSLPYWDVKQWSIGYGTGIGYDKNKKPAVQWSVTEAVAALKTRLTSDLNYILAKCKKPLTEGQKIALLSFAYNLGRGNLDNIIRRLNEGVPNETIAAVWRKYILVAGQADPHQIKRREAELTYFLS